MSSRAVSTSGANTTRTGTPRSRSLAIASGGLKLSAAGDHEVGARGRRSSRRRPSRTWRRRGSPPRPRAGYGREVLDLADDPVAHAEREQDLGRGRRERDDLLGSAAIVTAVALVVGQRDREQGAAVGASARASAAASAARRGGGGGERRGGRAGGWRPAPSRRRGRRPAGAAGGRGTGCGDGGRRPGACDPRGTPAGEGWKTKTPRSGVEARGQAVDRTMRLTFLSKARAATADRRPDFRPMGAVTVAGLCRTHTGFATCRVGSAGTRGSRLTPRSVPPRVAPDGR